MRINHMFHKANDDTDVAVAASYNVANKSTIFLSSFPASALHFSGRLSSLAIDCKAIGGTVDTLTIRMTSDPAGDKCIVSDTEADISICRGLTTNTEASIFYKLDIDWVMPLSESLYIFYKTNTGTLTVDKATMVWRE